MNIIEAIKSGKFFRRRCKEWGNKDFIYIPLHQECKLLAIDLISEDWEVKEPEQLKFTVLHSGTIFPFENLSRQIKREEKMKFDPTKPVQQRNGRKAKIIYIGEIEKSETFQPIFAIMEDEEGYESVETFCTDGSFYHPNDEQGASKFDLVNIPDPEQKEITINVEIFENGKCMFMCGRDFMVEDKFLPRSYDLHKILDSIGENLKQKEK